MLKNFGKSAIYPILLRLLDAALYVGRRSLAYYQHFHYPAERLFFSPHCVDVDWFAARATIDERVRLRTAHGIGPDAKVLLFAGKLVPFKRPLDLSKAAAICRASGTNVEVMVAGDGPLKSELVAENGAAPIHLLGFCNQTKMPAVYAASDVLVLPSDARETWGLVANEALACGRPIILSDAVGAGPDLADTEETGLTFPVANATALAEAIRKLLALPPSLEALAAKSRAYSPAAAAHGIEDALGALRLAI
jgi:glycosyltransferase involved in cell wall biosynthesis